MKGHGMSQTKEYKVWQSIKQRCTNPKATHYDRYGGRGITMCDEWMNSFIAFYEHVGSKPSPSHEIDRIENHLGYEPGNVRWSTHKQQMNNNSRNRHLTYRGKTYNIMQWSEKTGIHHNTIQRRLNLGWSHEKILTTPSDSNRFKKLDMKLAIEMRGLRGMGVKTEALAKMFAVSKATVNRVLSGEIYSEGKK